MGLRKVLLSAVVVGLLAVVAQAGIFVEGTFLCTFPSEATHTHDWSFDYNYRSNVEVSGQTVPVVGFLSLDESCHAYGVDCVDMSGETAGDPVFHVQKTVENDTDFVWTSYELTLSGNATFLPTASSNKFTVISYPDAQTIIFAAPVAVYPTQSVTLDVDINVPTTGSFGFTMTQLAVPEPITIGLLAAGAGVLFVRRRK